MWACRYHGVITTLASVSPCSPACVRHLAWVTYCDRRRMTEAEAELVVKIAGWKEALFIIGGPLGGLFIGASL